MNISTRYTLGSTLGLLAGAGGLYWLWQRLSKDVTGSPAAAFAGEGADPGSFVNTRDAGPENTRDCDGEDWDYVDQSSDESFPSSDPPARNDFHTPEPISYPDR